MDTVYLETSIVSHATARPSSNAATAVLQNQAKRWMDEQRPLYDVVTSQLVIDEAGMGDVDAASRRLEMLDAIPVLAVNPDAETVADEIVRRSNFLGVTTMTRNTILAELHAARRQILANYSGDTAAYLRDAQARLAESGRPIAHREQRTIRCTGAAKSTDLPVEDQPSPPGDR